MVKVKNNHKGLLNVAGVDVRPGAEVEVDDSAFSKWSNSHAAKQWLAGTSPLVSVDKKVKAEPKSTPTVNVTVNEKANSGNSGPTEREQLEARAVALQISFTSETSDEDLTNAVAEAEQAAAADERTKLLEEARALGLNPNVNTGIEKLKKQIAEKKAG